MLEVIFEFIVEVLLSGILEILTEIGVHSVGSRSDNRPNVWLAAAGYTLLGAIMGGISLLIFPSNFVTGDILRILNLILTPVAVGLMMCLVGAWRARRGDRVLRIDRFACGYLFALSLAVVRYFCAN